MKAFQNKTLTYVDWDTLFSWSVCLGFFFSAVWHMLAGQQEFVETVLFSAVTFQYPKIAGYSLLQICVTRMGYVIPCLIWAGWLWSFLTASDFCVLPPVICHWSPASLGNGEEPTFLFVQNFSKVGDNTVKK